MIIKENSYSPGLTERLKKVRTELGLSSVQLSKSLDIEPYQWERFESGETLPSTRVISAVSRKYGLNEEYLVFGTGQVLSTDLGLNKADSPRDGLNICDRLRSLRGNRSTYAFAKMCGIGLQIYEAIEDGTKDASVKQIKRIAEATGVGEKWLLTGDEKSKEWPVNDVLIAYLEEHPEARKELWEKIGEPEDLGSKLKEKRLERGLTQKQVAEMLGVTRVTIVEIEVGGRKNDYALMEKVRSWISQG